MPERVKIEDILKANNATLAETAACGETTAPDGSDLDFVDQLGLPKNDLATAKATIAKFTTRDALVAALITAWQATQKGGGVSSPPTTTPPTTTPPTTTPVQSTTVPPGGVDVTSGSFPTLKAEKEGSIATFTIPKSFQASGDTTPFVGADQIEPWQWLIVARRNNLTTALDLNKLLDPVKIDAHADKPAFLWAKQSGAIIDTTQGEESSRVSVSIDEDQAARHMMADGSIAGNYAFCEASVKASYKTQTEEARYSKVVHIRARWRQNRCKLVMENCLKVAPIFQNLINTALDQKQIKPEDQFDFLSQLFDKFGHVVPKYVYLGAQLELSRDVVSVENDSKTSTTTKVDTAIKAKVQTGGGGGLGATIGYGTDNTGIKEQSKYFEGVTFLSDGATATETSNPQAWLPGTNDPEKWKIIYQEDTTPITEWLELSQRQQIDTIVAKKQSEAWNSPLVADLRKTDGGTSDLPNQTLPYFPSGHLVTFMSQRASVFDDSSKRVYLEAKNGVFGNTPDHGAQPEDSKDANGAFVQPGDARRVVGTYYAWCQPAPLRALEGAGDSPKEAGLLWKLVYTGQCSAHHEALYWIVTADEQWALSVFRIPNYGNFACLLPYEEAKKLRTKDSPPRWIFRPAIPPGRLVLPQLTDENSGYFRVFNPFCSGYLGDEFLMNSWRKYVTRAGSYIEQPGGTYHEGKGPGVTTEEPGPQFGRTMVRSESAAELASVFDPNTGMVNPVQETAQQNTYNTRCWVIQDRSTRPSKKQFQELEDSSIENWINDHQSKLRK